MGRPVPFFYLAFLALCQLVMVRGVLTNVQTIWGVNGTKQRILFTPFGITKVHIVDHLDRARTSPL